MRTVSPEAAGIILRDYRVADRDWVAAVNVQHYTDVEGFDASFAKAASDALDLLELQISNKHNDFIIAEVEQGPVGCIFFAAESKTAGRVRLFYLDTAYRGLGVGKRMLSRIIERAVENGFRRICVSTFDRHLEACSLYTLLGFQRTIHEPSTAFGKKMRQIDFELDLSSYST
ncbi:GNAT family N-acetyltransferase [Roseovarius sp. M141]|uniref:GNAT family N-acetyltransferase n=1 Tax=Roseovarius sp. M141 TaxID=2583806 RepID=UPI0020CB9CB5|nr:GNAT family N-acetyltransferase [Roseovarius sp. M141]